MSSVFIKFTHNNAINCIINTLVILIAICFIEFFSNVITFFLDNIINIISGIINNNIPYQFRKTTSIITSINSVTCPPCIIEKNDIIASYML